MQQALIWRHASLAAITKQSQSATQVVERPDQIEHAESHQTTSTEELFQKMRNKKLRLQNEKLCNFQKFLAELLDSNEGDNSLNKTKVTIQLKNSVHYKYWK